jgi:hypothetical protein
MDLSGHDEVVLKLISEDDGMGRTLMKAMPWTLLEGT